MRSFLEEVVSILLAVAIFLALAWFFLNSMAYADGSYTVRGTCEVVELQTPKPNVTVYKQILPPVPQPIDPDAEFEDGIYESSDGFRMEKKGSSVVKYWPMQEIDEDRPFGYRGLRRVV